MSVYFSSTLSSTLVYLVAHIMCTYLPHYLMILSGNLYKLSHHNSSVSLESERFKIVALRVFKDLRKEICHFDSAIHFYLYISVL